LWVAQAFDGQLASREPWRNSSPALAVRGADSARRRIVASALAALCTCAHFGCGFFAARAAA
jgi:hypothetical protein